MQVCIVETFDKLFISSTFRSCLQHSSSCDLRLRERCTRLDSFPIKKTFSIYFEPQGQKHIEACVLCANKPSLIRYQTLAGDDGTIFLSNSSCKLIFRSSVMVDTFVSSENLFS